MLITNKNCVRWMEVRCDVISLSFPAMAKKNYYRFISTKKWL